MKWWLRSCTRCGGDLHEEVHRETDDVVCLQCGAIYYGQPPLDELCISQREDKEAVAVKPASPAKEAN